MSRLFEKSEFDNTGSAEQAPSPVAIKWKGENRTALGIRGTVLPDLFNELEPGTSIHVPSFANWSLHDMVAHILNIIGPAHVYLTTWAISEEPVRMLVQLMEEKTILSLKCIFNHRVKVECPKAYQLAQFNIATIKLSRIHAKVALFENEKFKITVVSSANLTRNPRIEVYVISCDDRLTDFYKEWIQKEIENAQPFN